ncbi:glycosyltransferase family 2 protein [Candidatus Peregrinibacteria bacterium]|jgi:UDP-N-acetylglucosamine---dolichyl-phosphate N-acetylglucosaminyltransferase|nr:glycosyltransferase family 2 protein [Candidatus Peregrinibacteria bacterium]
MIPLIVIPAYNEEKAIGQVLENLKKGGYTNILVINDGSQDKTEEIVKKHQVNYLSHAINRGLGGALGTGLKAAKKMGVEIAITFDADGQHAVEDLAKVIAPLKNKEAEVVIGSRLLNPEGMPLHRRLFNWIGNIVTYVLFGIWVTDSQSGLRAFSKKALQVIDIKTNKMEVSSEIIREIGANNLKLKEIPIKAIYTEYSLSKGQNFFVGVKTFIKLVIHRLMH